MSETEHNETAELPGQAELSEQIAVPDSGAGDENTVAESAEALAAEPTANAAEKTESAEPAANAADKPARARKPREKKSGGSTFDKKLLKRIVEGLLLASNEPLTPKRILEIFDEDNAPELDEIQAAIDEIQADCRDHGYELKEVASGWRYQVRQDLAPWVGRLWEEKAVRYSRAILETLALIAYRQPITRGDIEEIRGVAVSTAIIKTLMERQWIRVVGHRDVPGRPSLYATTRQFLDYFNLKSLDELPSLGEIRDIDKINAELDFEQEQQMAQALAPRLAESAGVGMTETDDETDDSATDSSSATASSRAVEEEDDAVAEPAVIDSTDVHSVSATSDVADADQATSDTSETEV